MSPSTGLWKTDGTVAGTTLVKTFSTLLRIFGTSAGYALVAAGESVSNYNTEYALWRTDGTAAGTTKLVNRFGTNFAEIAGRSYFLANQQYYSSDATELWRTDGTEQTTHLIARGHFTNLAAAAGTLYVVRYDEASGAELWKSDGTADGMTLVKDIKPGTASSTPEALVAAGNLLFFTADDGVNGRELWRTDGTEAGTFMVKDIGGTSSYGWYSPIVPRGRYVYFTPEVSGTGDLWRSDGTAAGTIRLTETATSGIPFRSLTPFDSRLVSVGYDAAHGVELWESDGTSGGTFVFAELVAGAGSANPQNLAVTRDRLFFTDGTKLMAIARAATRITIADRRVVEGNYGTTTVQFTVTRSGDLTGASTISYATESITATAGSDYQSNAGTVSFSAGESSKPIDIVIFGDLAAESNEFFAVNLTAATGGTIVTDRAIGVIEEDDRRVALSLAYVPQQSSSYSTSRVFRVTNSGNAGATVALKVSESPYEGVFTCDGKNPSTCGVGLVPAGGFVDFTMSRSSLRGTVDPAVLPGMTLTATVSALEAEDDLTDNTISRMIGTGGTVSVPSVLLAGTTVSAQASAPYGAYTVQLSMSGAIVVSPGSAQVTQANPTASFTVTVSPSAYGSSLVKLNNSEVMRVPIAMSGEAVKLDASITVPSEYQMEFAFDQEVKLPVVVAGTLPDGTRPSGSVQLINNADRSVLKTQDLDAAGKATFTFPTLPVGTYQYSVSYAGDGNFNPLKVNMPQIVVRGWTTYTDVVTIEQPCGDSEIAVSVFNSDKRTPTGTVKITVDSVVVATLGLVPGTTAGTATAALKNYVFNSSNYYSYVVATYVPTGNFSASSDTAYRYASSVMTCPAPTLIATPSSGTSVAIVWSAVGAAQYEVLRAEAPSRTTFTPVGTTASSSFTDTTVVAGKAYLYKVNAKTNAGVVRSTSGADVATAMAFTNDPTAAGSTVIKAVHMTELQTAATALRNLAGLPPVTFAVITPGSTIVHNDFTSLRTAIQEALTALGYSVSWVDPGARASTIRAVQLQQLRNVTK